MKSDDTTQSEGVLAVIAQLSQPRRLLVVNSDTSIQTLFREFAVGKNCTLDFATTASQAIARYTPERYDAVIIDMTISDAGGMVVFEDIRDRSPKKSIYIMSEILPTELWNSAKQQNRFVIFVPKPNNFSFEFIGQLFEAVNIQSA